MKKTAEANDWDWNVLAFRFFSQYLNGFYHILTLEVSAHHVRNNVSLITLLKNRTCTLFLTAPRAVLLPPTNHVRYSSATSVCEHPLLSPPCAPSVTTFYHLLLTPHFFVPMVHFCHHLLSPPSALAPSADTTQAPHTRSLATKREPAHRRCFGGKNAL